MSHKKLFGDIGCGIFFFICVYGVIRQPENTVLVLGSLFALIVALYGLKSYTGIQAKKLEKENKNG